MTVRMKTNRENKEETVGSSTMVDSSSSFSSGSVSSSSMITKTLKRKRDSNEVALMSEDQLEMKEENQSKYSEEGQQSSRENETSFYVVSSSSTSSSSAAPKRIRRTFTDRAKSDVVTLPLAFSFLDVYSLLKSRRVCSIWQTATRRSLAWQHTILACNLEWIDTLPSSSIMMVRSLCLVRDLKAPLPDLKNTFKYLSGLSHLTSLRLEEVTLDGPFCDLLAKYLPNLKQLDIKMASEYEDDEMKRRLKMLEAIPPPLEDGEENSDDDEEDNSQQSSMHDSIAHVDPTVLAQYESEASSYAYKSVSSLSSLGSPTLDPAALTWLRGFSGLPTLHLPNLLSLKLPYSRSWGHILTITEPIERLETLQVRRIATLSRTLDTRTSESHWLKIMNYRFQTRYADSLKHLSLMNIHYHTFDEYDFKSLHVLTHLSLTQNSNFPAITKECLQMIGSIAQLEETEIKVGNGALEACLDYDWWIALSNIKSLGSLSIWNPNKVTVFTRPSCKIFNDGLQTLIATSHCRLHTLQLSNEDHIDDEIVKMITNAKTLHTLSFYSAAVSLDCLSYLAFLPRLTSLEVIACRSLHTSAGLIELTNRLPRLRSLSFRLPSASAQRQGGVIAPSISDEAWLHLPKLANLTSLHLSGYGQISQYVVDGWCQQAREGMELRQKLDEATLKRFSGFEESFQPTTTSSTDDTTSTSASLLHSSSSFSLSSSRAPVGVSWQEVRCSGWMISTAQSLALLRNLPQLQMLSVHLLETSVGSFTTPETFNARLLFGGGDYMQRQIASYISPTYVLR